MYNMNKKLRSKRLPLIGFLLLFLFIPQSVVWGGLDPQTVPTLPPTATATSTVTVTSTLTATSTITSKPTTANTSTTIPPTITQTFTATQLNLGSDTFTPTPQVVVPPRATNFLTFLLLGLVAAIVFGAGILAFFLILRKKKTTS